MVWGLRSGFRVEALGLWFALQGLGFRDMMPRWYQATKKKPGARDDYLSAKSHLPKTPWEPRAAPVLNPSKTTNALCF